ncbi:hypothetical protein AC249_AIPGENE17298 [Exaiptasia diaphana]|nr:hypothetical protein AC249_AIPGENE17298 [Exaiptasia diaphana]
MSLSITSERQQMKALKKSNPVEFEGKDFCVVSFPKENRYSVVSVKLLVDAPEDLQPLSPVLVKEGAKRYNGLLMFVGSKEKCTDKAQELEIVMGTPKSSAPKSSKRTKQVISDDDSDDDGDSVEASYVEREVNSELEKLKSLKNVAKKQNHKDHPPKQQIEALHTLPSTSTQEVQDTAIKDRQWDLVIKKLNHIISLLETRNNVPVVPQLAVCTPPPSKKFKLETSDTRNGCSSPDDSTPSSAGPSLMHEGFNLLSISSGGDPRKYGLKVFSQLFSKSEMSNGMVGPLDRAKTRGKVELDGSRIELLKKAISLKFSADTLAKKWAAIRSSCNQKCLDQRKNQVRQDAPAAVGGLQDLPPQPNFPHDQLDDE